MTADDLCIHDMVRPTCTLCRPRTQATRLADRTTDCERCGGTIVWVTTTKMRLMPMDAEPSADGTFRLAGMTHDDSPRVAFVRPEDRPSASVPLFTTHLATCPEADPNRRS